MASGTLTCYGQDTDRLGRCCTNSSQSQRQQISPDWAVIKNQINMHDEFAHFVHKVDTKVGDLQITETAFHQTNANYGRKQKCMRAQSTDNAQMDDEDGQLFDLWALPTELKRTAWATLSLLLLEKQVSQFWSMLRLYCCFTLCVDIVILLATQDARRGTSRTCDRLRLSVGLTRCATSRFLVQLIRIGMLLLVLRGQQIMNNDMQLYKLQIPQNSKFKSTKSTDYMRSFGVEVKAYVPKAMQNIKYLRTVGDGNCLWRAVAKFTPFKWYSLKRKTINHMMQKIDCHHNHKMIDSIKELAKSNAWGNQDAIMGLCSYLEVDILVATRSAVLHFKCAADGAPLIYVQLQDQHYSTIRRRDGENIFRKCSQNVCITLEDYYDLDVWSPTTIKGFKAHGDRIGNKRFASKSGHSKKSSSSTAEAMPVYRPAGPNIGPPKRLAHESVADQIRRVEASTC